MSSRTSYFFQLSLLIFLATLSLNVSATTYDSTVTKNITLYLKGKWCLNTEIVEAYDAKGNDDVSFKGEFWNFSEDGKYTFDVLGDETLKVLSKDPFEIIENKIKMTNFGTLEVLEISSEKMVAKALSTYHFTKDKCSAETLNAVKLTQLNNSIILNDISRVKQLINEGIDVSKKDTRSSIGSTPLMVAVRNINIPIIKLILEQKPDLSVKNYADKSALDYAKISKSQEIKELIKNAY